MLELLDRAELRVDRIVAAQLAADRPRTPRIIGSGHEGVVRTLSEGRSDGMNGREIDDVEAELGDPRQGALSVAEGAMALRVIRLRARKHLVPRGEAGALTVDGDRQDTAVAGEVARNEVRLHELEQLGRERCPRADPGL